MTSVRRIPVVSKHQGNQSQTLTISVHAMINYLNLIIISCKAKTIFCVLRLGKSVRIKTKIEASN